MSPLKKIQWVQERETKWRSLDGRFRIVKDGSRDDWYLFDFEKRREDIPKFECLADAMHVGELRVKLEVEKKGGL